MKVNLLKIYGTWRDVADSARTTSGKEPGEGEPSSSWKRRILLAEHSPIRKLKISWKWIDIKYWISVHLVRHNIGITHFVKTQRPDRTGKRDGRDNEFQGALINHECEANAQAIINISRKRLCNQAQPETRAAWKAFLESIKDKEPELYSVCVPECLYRGWCYELKDDKKNPCNYYISKEYKKRLNEYRNNINGWIPINEE